MQAEAGDASAQYRLGVLFLLGSGMEQDTEAACRWLLAAAEGHHRDAQALVERLAPFYLGALEQGDVAKTPRVLQNWLAAVTRLTKVNIDRCEEAAKRSMHVFRSCLTGKMTQKHRDAKSSSSLPESD